MRWNQSAAVWNVELELIVQLLTSVWRDRIICGDVRSYHFLFVAGACSPLSIASRGTQWSRVLMLPVIYKLRCDRKSNFLRVSSFQGILC